MKALLANIILVILNQKQVCLFLRQHELNQLKKTFENFFQKRKTFIVLKSVTMFNHVVTFFLQISFFYL